MITIDEARENLKVLADKGRAWPSGSTDKSEMLAAFECTKVLLLGRICSLIMRAVSK